MCLLRGTKWFFKFDSFQIPSSKRQMWICRWISLLGTFAKFRKATIIFVMSVHLSAWNNSAPTGRMFMKFRIWIFFWKSVEKIQVSFKSDKNNEFFTWKHAYVYDNISLNSSRTMTDLSDKTCRENQNTFYVQYLFL